MTEPREEQRAAECVWDIVCDFDWCVSHGAGYSFCDQVLEQRNAEIASLRATNSRLREFIQEYVLCECPQNAVAECCPRCLMLKGAG
jgi:hypothetical protein